MENRLKKLMNEEDRLRKQIQLANRHTAFADQVADRRNNDFNMKMMYHNDIESVR